MKLKALKIRIYPNKTQEVQLSKTFGCCRFIYNQMLSERIDLYKQLKDKPKQLYEHKYKTEKQYKEEFEWLKEVDSIALQQARMNLGTAYENFYRKVKDPKVPSSEKGFPKFKKKHSRNSFRCVLVNNNIRIDFDKKKIRAPKLGWIKFHDDRRIENIQIHSITFSKNPSRKFYASVLYEDKTPDKKQVDLKKKDLKVKGLDMSLTNFFVDDEGNSPQYDQNYRKAEKKIARLQQKLSEKSFKHKKKIKLRLARVHEHIANKRKDFIEKLSAKLVKENDVIAIESLSMKDIARFRTWEERKDSKDKNNHGKSVNDLGWNCFVNRLKTKAQEQGKIVIEASKWFASTQTCNICGYKNKDLKIQDRSWICPTCGTEHYRDQNAAINLRDVALDRIFTAGSAGSAGASRNGNHLQ